LDGSHWYHLVPGTAATVGPSPTDTPVQVSTGLPVEYPRRLRKPRKLTGISPTLLFEIRDLRVDLTGFYDLRRHTVYRALEGPTRYIHTDPGPLQVFRAYGIYTSPTISTQRQLTYPAPTYGVRPTVHSPTEKVFKVPGPFSTTGPTPTANLLRKPTVLYLPQFYSPYLRLPGTVLLRNGTVKLLDLTNRVRVYAAYCIRPSGSR